MMSDLRTILERGVGGETPPPDGFERMLRRRDRKRGNQRIAAGVVGLAVFVAAIGVVTTGLLFDQTPTEGVPGPAETGPTVAPDTGWDGYSYRIPPEGTALSTPVEGELIAQGEPFSRFGFVSGSYVRVYADGRVISWTAGSELAFDEQRLSPEGIEFVRSGAVQPEDLVGRPTYVTNLPAIVWEDREGKPYVPARYAACFWVDSPRDHEADVDPSRVLDLLPASAQALLRGSDPAVNPGCLEVPPEDARSLEEILSESGLIPQSSYSSVVVGEWLLRDGGGDRVGIRIHPLFPDGRRLIQP